LYLNTHNNKNQKIMKRTILLSLLLVIYGVFVFAGHIDESTARKVMQSFLNSRANSLHLPGSSGADLVYRAGSTVGSPDAYTGQTTLFYVFNTTNPGFVIIAGDDRVIPVLGYSDEVFFDPGNLAPNVRKWLEEYKNQIRDVVENDLPATEEIAGKWEEFLNGDISVTDVATGTAVNPLVQTKWNQAPYYNAMCPGGSVTGCVATAMAQIMKFWNHPATGSGFHSYNHSNYGTISANFGGTTYQWSSMPDNVNSTNTAVAELMYHCGVSVDMDYSPQVSGAYVITAQSPVQNCSEYAMKTYFGYKSTMQGVQRTNYAQSQWVSLLKGELDAGRPILYAGFGSGGGHAFVCDGYDNNEYFHFNWGWGGAYDGYFYINALNPSGTGTGGGSGGYNSGHQALIKIEPPSGGGTTNNMSLYNYVSTSASPIYYGQSFDVITNIANFGTSTFNGDYCAAVFDDQYNFIDYVEILTGYTLQSGYAYTNNLVFQTNGLFSMLPGTYYIGIFYRPTGGNWIQVSDNGNYTNLEQLNVINPNDIEMYAAMTVSPGTTLIQGQSVSVNLNVVNDGNSTFYGQYGVGLYSLDGNLAQTIGILNENNGLPSGYIYLSPYLTFTSGAVTVSPGTYLLAVQHNPNNTGWQLTGSSYYQNPIKVSVQAAALSPDIYEANNNVNQASNLTVSFSGNNAVCNTNGSSLHTGTDNDFYKITLSDGYDYSINARLHDSYNSGNGNTYTVDALFSFSPDGSNWSDAFDDVMPGYIAKEGGGTMFFHVAPYFAGETGTYLLDLAISRAPSNSIAESDPALIRVFPNPAANQVTADLGQFPGRVNRIELVNIHGQTLVSLVPDGMEKTLRISVQDCPEGIYFMHLQTSQGRFTQKIIVIR
jgi:hypothetical protein